MKILLYGDILTGGQWLGCKITVSSTNEMVELRIEGGEGQDCEISVDFDMLEYAVRTIREAPDFEDTSSED